jgi:predicted AlkP superfamily pyrophosphatase or phosphodiesterase
MNHRGLVSLLVIAACGGAPPHDGAGAPAGGGRVIVVSIDGLMPDAYLAPDAHGLAIPTLRSLVARGAAGRVRGVMPTVTYPSGGRCTRRATSARTPTWSC